MKLETHDISTLISLVATRMEFTQLSESKRAQLQSILEKLIAMSAPAGKSPKK